MIKHLYFFFSFSLLESSHLVSQDFDFRLITFRPETENSHLRMDVFPKSISMYEKTDPSGPCSKIPEYRQFDFWIGEWSVTDTKSGSAAGNSKVELILNDCVILENWQPAMGAAGKSINTYNQQEKKWRQTWVDASGAMTELYDGEFKDGTMMFYAKPDEKGNVLRLSFKKISTNEVRQIGEMSADNKKTWSDSFDLTYKRKS
jgi:hypothetical protein